MLKGKNIRKKVDWEQNGKVIFFEKKREWEQHEDAKEIRKSRGWNDNGG